MPGVYHNSVAPLGPPSRMAALAPPVAGHDPAARAAVRQEIDPLCFDPVDAGRRVKINVVLCSEGR